MKNALLSEPVDIQKQLDSLSDRGGVVNLASACYDIHSSLVLDTPSVCLSGGVWACNTDPNGVFESKFGTKLRAHGTDYPLLVIGKKCDPISGACVRDLGFQGDIIGMDTRPLADPKAPQKSGGLCFNSVRVDQCEFAKLAFCGLGNAVVAMGGAELDACIFDGLNLDGCGNGVWFSPKASYYTRFRGCVIADNPYYGFYLDGKGKHIHNLELQDCYFVRNGGAFTGVNAAAVYFDGASDCSVTNCVFDAPGVFWYYDSSATENSQRQPSYRESVALLIQGNRNRICNNTFLNSSAESIVIKGNENILLGNIADGNVRICGEGNVVSSLVFTSPKARLILEGKATTTTTIFGVVEDRIVRLEDTLGG